MNNDVRLAVNEKLQTAIDTLAKAISESPFNDLDIQGRSYNGTIANIAIHLFHKQLEQHQPPDNVMLYQWEKDFSSPTSNGDKRIRINAANIPKIEPIATALLPTSIGERIDTGRGWNRPLIVVISLAWLYHNHRSIIENYINLQRRD